MEDMEKSQTSCTEMKTTVSEMNNILDVINKRCYCNTKRKEILKNEHVSPH